MTEIINLDANVTIPHKIKFFYKHTFTFADCILMHIKVSNIEQHCVCACVCHLGEGEHLKNKA